MEEPLRQKIFDIIQKELSRDPAGIDPDKPIRDQVSLDSMQFVSLMARVELGLNIELPISAMEAKTLNEFLEVVEKTVKEASAA